ncbi:MAG: hypothetical protein Q4C96_09835 [Planctomycetia bacterium]|nr:hypothetical protein [Planctomycetia bacterium]
MDDYRIPPLFSPVCSKTKREICPGETFYTVLIEEKDSYIRENYSLEAWDGPPKECVGYWKTKIPEKRDALRHKTAVNDILLLVFDHLYESGQNPEKLYILALLMIRRRIFRLDEEEHSPHSVPRLNVYCPRRDESYLLPVRIPDQDAQDEIQKELARLLEGDAEITGAEEMEEEMINIDEIELPEITEIDPE